MWKRFGWWRLRQHINNHPCLHVRRLLFFFFFCIIVCSFSVKVQRKMQATYEITKLNIDCYFFILVSCERIGKKIIVSCHLQKSAIVPVLFFRLQLLAPNRPVFLWTRHSGCDKSSWWGLQNSRYKCVFYQQCVFMCAVSAGYSFSILNSENNLALVLSLCRLSHVSVFHPSCPDDSKHATG